VVRASGTVVPGFERVLSSPVEARVLRRLQEPGAVLAAGQAILELDTSDIERDLADIRERLARNANDRRQRRLELADELAELERRLESQQLDLEMARYRLSQNTTLHGEGLVSSDTLKESEVAVRKGEIELRQINDRMASARQSHEAKLESLDLDASLLRREETSARQRLEQAMARTEEPGVLTWLIEDVGATVQRGEILARIANPDAFQVEATVADAYATRLEVGQTVRVEVGVESLTGTLSRILPAIESGALTFMVDLERPDHPSLRQNLRVDVLVVTGSRRDVLLTPRGPYIQGGGALHQVFVARGDRAVRSEVTLGLAGAEHFEVVSGLTEGDEIIVSDMRDRLYATALRLR
jgi:HlyD family secretion protein